MWVCGGALASDWIDIRLGAQVVLHLEQPPNEIELSSRGVAQLVELDDDLYTLRGVGEGETGLRIAFDSGEVLYLVTTFRWPAASDDTRHIQPGAWMLLDLDLPAEHVSVGDPRLVKLRRSPDGWEIRGRRSGLTDLVLVSGEHTRVVDLCIDPCPTALQVDAPGAPPELRTR